MEAEPRTLRPVLAEPARLEPLAGREEICDHLARLIAAATADRKRAAVISGVRGIGKTTLLRWALAYGERAGSTAVLLRPPMTDVLAAPDVARELLRTLGTERVAAAGDPPPTVLRLAHALSARSEPVLVCIDDLHRIARDAFDMIADATRLADTPVTIVATIEPGEPVLTSSGDLWVEALRLHGLSERATGTLARAVAGASLAPSLVKRLHEETGGNPLFVREIVRDWLERDLLERTGSMLQARDPADLPIPDSIQDLVAGLVNRLDDRVRLVATILAAFDRPVSFAELLTAAGGDTAALADALGRLEARGFAIRSSSGFQLATALLGGAVRERLSLADRDDVTSRVVASVRAHDGDPVELARHAVSLLEPPADLREILDRAAGAAMDAGLSKTAADLLDELARRERDPGERARVLIRKAHALLRVTPADAITAVDDARAADPAADDDEFAALRARALLFAGRIEEAEAALNDALGRPLTDDTRDLVTYALGCARIMMGERDEVRRLLEPLARKGMAGAASSLAFIDAEAGRFAEATAHLERAIPNAASAKDRIAMRASLAGCQLYAGDWVRARASTTEALQETWGSGDNMAFLAVSDTAVSLHAWQGELDDALDLASKALRLAEVIGAGILQACLMVLLAHTEAGTPRDGIAIAMERLGDDVDERGERDGGIYQLALAEAFLAAGDLTEARARIDRAEPRLRSELLWAVGVDRVRALISLAENDVAAAAGALQPWIDAPSNHVFEQARIRELMAEVGRRMRRKTDARTHATEALETYERLGARIRTAHLRGWLERRLGGAVKPARSPDELSEREREIATLVVSGLTNAEIAAKLVISPATVKKHVENMLAKTGARRRADLHRFVT